MNIARRLVGGASFILKDRRSLLITPKDAVMKEVNGFLNEEYNRRMGSATTTNLTLVYQWNTRAKAHVSNTTNCILLNVQTIKPNGKTAWGAACIFAQYRVNTK